MCGSCLQLFRLASIAFCLILAACGSGGGGGDDPFGDGLGISGQIAGTVSIGPSGGGEAPKVTLDDVGRALAVWFGSNNDMVSSRDLGGGWETPAPINAAQDVRDRSLRANSGGSAVLGWSGTQNDIKRIIRYSPLGGWDGAATDLPASNFYPRLSDDADLSILTNDTVVVSRQTVASMPSGGKISSFRIFKHEVPGGWTTVLETEPHRTGDAYLAANPSGSAILFSVVGDTQPDGNWKYLLRLYTLDLVSGGSLAPFSFADGVYTPCQAPSFTIRAVNSATPRKALAIMERNSPDPGCSLYLIRANTFNLTAEHRRMNPPGTYVYMLPQMAMNGSGDALAVWSESDGSSSRVMWSQSLQGDPWSDPEPLPVDPSLGQLSTYIALAMNANGQAVAAINALRNGQQYLLTGRFSFNTGWTGWRAVSAISATLPAVAINSSGDGLVVYGATPCDRLPTGGYTNCRSAEMYALRF